MRAQKKGIGRYKTKTLSSRLMSSINCLSYLSEAKSNQCGKLSPLLFTLRFTARYIQSKSKSLRNLKNKIDPRRWSSNVTR